MKVCIAPSKRLVLSHTPHPTAHLNCSWPCRNGGDLLLYCVQGMSKIYFAKYLKTHTAKLVLAVCKLHPRAIRLTLNWHLAMGHLSKIKYDQSPCSSCHAHQKSSDPVIRASDALVGLSQNLTRDPTKPATKAALCALKCCPCHEKLASDGTAKANARSVAPGSCHDIQPSHVYRVSKINTGR